MDRVDPLVFNGNPPKPNEVTHTNHDRISSIKLKDLFQNDGNFKSKQMIQELLGYQFSFNSYMHLRSTAFQCPLHVMPNKKPHKSFSFFAKSLRNSKQLRIAL